MKGLALSSGERIEAYLLFAENGEQVDLLRFGCREKELQLQLLTPLVRHLAADVALPLFVPRISGKEVSAEVLAKLGFARKREYGVYLAQAKPC